MVIALFALSLVMILGGFAAVVQGFPYVRLESGLVMVTGGATAASAGAIVLAIAVALIEVRKLLTDIGRRGVAAPAIVADAVPAAPALRAPSHDMALPPVTGPATVTAGAAGLAGVTLAAARDLLGGGERGLSTDSAPLPSQETELPLPGLIPPAVPEPVPPPAPGEPVSAEDDLFVSPPDRAEDRPGTEVDEPKHPDTAQEELALRPALEEPASESPAVPDALPGEPAAEPAEEPDKNESEPGTQGLQVVGTYSSGANTYVMFANGTIQADTPRGRFTFQSLDELKEFVDSGGEATARGAA